MGSYPLSYKLYPAIRLSAWQRVDTLKCGESGGSQEGVWYFVGKNLRSLARNTSSKYSNSIQLYKLKKSCKDFNLSAKVPGAMV